MDTTLPLRARQRAALLADIHRTAHRLFADRGFDAVTTEDIAAAVGISPSTLFRHVASKEGLLVEPVLEHVSGIVGAYASRPADENAGPALVAAMVDRVSDPDSHEMEVWLTAIRSAPHLINRVTLVTPADRDRLIQLASERMATQADNLKPALLVQIVLAAAEFVFQRWIAGDGPTKTPLPAQVHAALTTVLSADW
jgi:AcrR family transcriptional regulator